MGVCPCLHIACFMVVLNMSCVTVGISMEVYGRCFVMALDNNGVSVPSSVLLILVRGTTVHYS